MNKYNKAQEGVSTNRDRGLGCCPKAASTKTSIRMANKTIDFPL